VSGSENPSVPFRSESPEYPNEPMTFAERLDAAQTGEEFGHVINLLFLTAFEATRHRGSGAPERESD
jgi:hypothetical protein